MARQQSYNSITYFSQRDNLKLKKNPCYQPGKQSAKREPDFSDSPKYAFVNTYPIPGLPESTSGDAGI